MQVSESDSWRTRNLHYFAGNALYVRSTREPGRYRRDCVSMTKRPAMTDVMTSKQVALLRKLAFDAYEPEAFAPNLTKVEAEQRISVLQAKLKLMGEPPHTL
jgi:hypothetical protein